MTTQTEEKKRSVKFKDEDGQSFIITVEITHRNGYPEFTASGDYGGGCGQCDSHIKPKNEAQRKLIDIWNKWHLNGMSAGTPEQDLILEGYAKQNAELKYDFDKACKILKSKRKYTVKHPETGEPYRYGSGWIHKKLPSNFWEQLQVILNQIEEIEEEEHKDEKKLSDFDFTTSSTEKESIIYVRFNEMFDNDAERVLALGVSEDLTVEEALDEINVSAYDNCILEYAGTSYLVGDDLVMDEKWDEDLENYIDDCILHELPEQYRQYFDNDAWKEDAQRNGSRGNSLNRYDGSEECQEINGTEYFIYQQ